MTLASATSKTSPFEGNSTATTFPFTFKTFSSADLVVTVTTDGVDTDLTLDSDYSVSLNADQNSSPGGSVTYPISGTPLPAGSTLLISRAVDYTQESDLLNGGNWNPETIENALDKQVMLSQQLAELISRCLQIPIGSSDGVSAKLPAPEANHFPVWNNLGTAMENRNLSDLIGQYTERVVDVFLDGADFTAGTTTALTLSADGGDEANLMVFFDGGYQQHDTFSVSGTALTFDAAIPIGTSKVEVLIGKVAPLGTTSTKLVQHNKYAVASRTVEQMFSDLGVSVMEFGAEFDGTTDDTVAIQAALDSGASVVRMPAGPTVISDTLVKPQYVSLIGSGLGSSTSLMGTTLLYSGTGECIRSAGTQDVVPAMHSRLENFRVRKTTAASTKAAVALISGAHVVVKNVRVDTENLSYKFAYGIVFDQSEVCLGENIQVQDVSTAGIWLVNGSDYTSGNSANYTNVIELLDVNCNGCPIGIAHDGGATFKVMGGNFNDCDIGIRLGGVNNFSLDSLLFEAGTGQADVVLSQYKKDGATSVGGCTSGVIANNRLSSATTNCIYVQGPGSQSNGIAIFGNRFGSARTGSAIGLSDADALLNSWIGPNNNLGGSGKQFLDTGVYTYNVVAGPFLASEAQSEAKQTTSGYQVMHSTANCGRKHSTTYVNGADYTVTDADEYIHVQTGASDRTITLPSKTGQRLHVLKKDAGAGAVLFSANINGASLSLTSQYDKATIWYDGAAWFKEA